MTLKSQTLAIIIAISLLSGVIGGAGYSKFAGPEISQGGTVIQQKTYIEESRSISAIEKVTPAVISVIASKDMPKFRQQPFNFFFQNDPFFEQFFPQMEQQEQEEPETEHKRIGGGSGFIVSADGLALTNRHVVSDEEADFTAVLADGSEYEIEVIDRDPLNDLAVVQLKKEGNNPSDLPFVEFGDSSVLKVGQRVLAIGYARGEYENSVTSGIVSAFGRQIQASDQAGGGTEVLSGLIQTDAAINFGNSGGPLINLEGQVIGMNTAIDAAASGIGFAIPIDDVKPIVLSVKEHGKIIRPMLGVRHIILTAERASELNLEGVEYGALLIGDRSKGEFAVVPDSPAESADLRIDDVILEVDGKQITTENTLQAVVRSHSPGDKLKLLVWRAGETFEKEVELGEFEE